MPKEIKFQIRCDETQLKRFAGLTGDFSSIHMDPQFARKTRYRKNVVHGMFVVAELARLRSAFPGRSVFFKRIAGRFLAPVFLDEPVEVVLEHSDCDFKLEALRSGTSTRLVEVTGDFALAPAPAAVPEPPSWLSQSLEEADWKDSAVSGRQESFRFTPASAEPELAATLLLSTMVGMRLPGKFATFTDFEMAFPGRLAPAASYRMTGKVERYSDVGQTAELAISIDDPKDPSGARLAQGKAGTLVSPPPAEEISAADIKGTFLDLGLEGKVALVTGASRGIGSATAKLLASLGARVVVHYFRGEADARRIVEEITEADGEALCLQADLRRPEQIRALVKRVADEWGTVDILVNNAVAEFTPKDVLNLEWDDYLAELEVSLKGLHELCRRVIPLMKKQSRGKIINLSSIATQDPVPGQNRYITVKSAVEGYTRSLAVELASSGIQVNLVLPAMTDTSLLAHLPRKLIDRIGQEKTAGRILKPIEVAQTIAFLASHWSDSISGQRFVLNQAEAPFL